MVLIQLLLPMFHNDGKPVSGELLSAVHHELMERFGGLTVYSRAPAEGMWRDAAAHKVQDELLLFEVMVADLDRTWWTEYQGKLERRFEQQEVLIRSFAIEKL